MNIFIDISWVISVLLISVRIGWFFFNTPLDALGYMPAKIKLLMILTLSTGLVNVLDVKLETMPVSIIDLLLLVATEMTIGLVMVMGLYCVFGALSLAGRIIDFQTGFGAAGLFNSATNNQEPLMGTVLTLAAAMWFFLADFHHYVIKAIALSLLHFPPGSPMADLSLTAVTGIFGTMFSFGMMLAAPVLTVLYLLDTAIAVMAKTMPQMNVYFLFMPLKIFVSLVVTGLLIRFMSPVLSLLFKQLENYWMAILL